MIFGSELFEISVLNGVREAVGCSFADAVMVFVSTIGNAGIIWIVCGFILAFTKKYRKSGIMLLVGLLLGLLIGNLLLKNLIARPRPCWIQHNVELLIDMPTDFSFPSGHTLSCFIAAFVLLDANLKFGAAALFLAVLTAFSRMYLFVHYPTDILGGIVLAAVIFGLMKLTVKAVGRYKKLRN